MLKGIKKSDKTTPKLNLIPILDAVFIFIFFLLMSAQFLDIFELETKAPAVKTFDEELKKDEKPPLNLTLEIKSNRIYVKTGLEGALVGSIDKQEDYDYIGLHQILKRIKKEHIDELSVIFKPSSSIPYEDIIKIMDSVREVPRGLDPIIAENKKGISIETKIMFNNIIFETIL